jgi:hypothetical protein
MRFLFFLVSDVVTVHRLIRYRYSHMGVYYAVRKYDNPKKGNQICTKEIQAFGGKKAWEES